MPVGPSTVRWASCVARSAFTSPKIAAAFTLDVEDKLAAILPASAVSDSGDDDRLFGKLYR
jgi:hypothetical protein